MEKAGWVCESRKDAALVAHTTKYRAVSMGQRSGFVWIELEEVVLISS